MYKRKRIEALDDEQRNDLFNALEEAEQEQENELALQNFLDLVFGAQPNDPIDPLLIEQTIASLLLNNRDSVSEGDSLWQDPTTQTVVAPSWSSNFVDRSYDPPQVQPDVSEDPPQVVSSSSGNRY